MSGKYTKQEMYTSPRYKSMPDEYLERGDNFIDLRYIRKYGRDPADYTITTIPSILRLICMWYVMEQYAHDQIKNDEDEFWIQQRDYNRSQRQEHHYEFSEQLFEFGDTSPTEKMVGGIFETAERGC